MKDILAREKPKYFYKYRPLSSDKELEFLLSVLNNDSLYWSSPLDFNDPFDCAPVPIISGSKEKKKLRLRKIIRRNAPNASWSELSKLYRTAESRRPREIEEDIIAANKSLMKMTSVCSLSELNDSILMWSHYASNHSGICLEFCSLSEQGWDRLADENIYFEKCLPVIYKKERPVIDLLSIESEELFKDSLLTKAEFWQYEREWRLIEYKEKPGLRKFPHKCLTGLIFGAKININHKKILTDAANKRASPPNLYQSEFDRRMFKLNISQIVD